MPTRYQIIDRILRESNTPNLLDVLADQLTPTDLQSLLPACAPAIDSCVRNPTATPFLLLTSVSSPSAPPAVTRAASNLNWRPCMNSLPPTCACSALPSPSATE